MRRGLRLTLRPNGNKPVGGRTEDQPAPGQDEDQPATGQAADQSIGATSAPEPPPGDAVAGQSAEEQTAELPAVSLPGDEPALSHEEYLPPGDRENAGEDAAIQDTAVVGTAIPGTAIPGTAASGTAAGGTAAGDVAAGGPATRARDRSPDTGTADPLAGSLAADPLASGEAEAPPAVDVPGSAGGVAAGAAEPAATGARHAAAQTAVLSVVARQWGKLGVGRRTGALWQRSVGLAWQRTIGRLGISRLWQPGPGVREAADPGARTLALITAMPVILLVAWLVPGLLLLLARAFLPAPMVLTSVPLAVALTILVARELPGRWPAPGTAQASTGASARPAAPASPGTPATAGTPVATDVSASPDPPAVSDTGAATGAPAAVAAPAAANVPAAGPGPAPRRGARRAAKNRPQAWAAWWGLLGTVTVAAVFAVWQLIENSPQFIVSRDPGAFAQFAFWIADHGSLPITASTAAFGGAHPGLTFASFGFATHGGAVVPSVMAGLPIVLAAGMWAHGVSGAAVISPLLGALAVLAVGGLTARLAGPQWAPAGALLLALTVPEIYTSRSAFSVTLAQTLLFGGLCLVVDSFSSRRRLTLASLGGLAIGLTVLAGASFLLLMLPVIVVAGALLAGRRPQAIPLAAGWLAGVVCGLGAGIGLDRPALSSTTPSSWILGALAGGLAVVTGLGAAIALVGPARRRAAKLLAARPLRWLPEAGAALVALAGIGLAVRPYLQKVRGPASPYVAALQRLEGLPVDPGRLYAENSLYWVIWYLGVPALLLGLIGLAMVTRTCLRALITWKDPTGAAQSWVLPAAIIGWGLFAVLWQPGTVPDQPWASRQLVPVVLPGLIVLAVWVAAWMIGRAHAREAGRVAVALATACFVIAMAVPPAAITFGIALAQPADPATRLALSGVAFRTTGAGEVSAVQQLCGAIPSHSSVVLLDQVAARAFAEVIRGMCGVPAGIVAAGGTGNVAAVIGGIERAGRHPALLATKPAELTPYGASPRQILNLATQQDEHLLTRPTTSTWPVRYTLWLSQPGGIPIGA